MHNKLLIIVIVAGALSACSPKMDDLTAYTAQIKQNTQIQVEPYPEFSSQPAFQYQETDRRSPFVRPTDRTERLVTQAQTNCLQPDYERPKEALEQSMPRLREMLAEQGIDLGESTISYGQSGNEQSDEGEGQSQGQTADKNTQQDKNDEQDGANPQSSRQQTSSSIDYYA